MLVRTETDDLGESLSDLNGLDGVHGLPEPSHSFPYESNWELESCLVAELEEPNGGARDEQENGILRAIFWPMGSEYSTN